MKIKLAAVCTAISAAACAALSNTKLEVRNSASLCSLNWLRSVPERTARVSNCAARVSKPAN